MAAILFLLLVYFVKIDRIELILSFSFLVFGISISSSSSVEQQNPTLTALARSISFIVFPDLLLSLEITSYPPLEMINPTSSAFCESDTESGRISTICFFNNDTLIYLLRVGFIPESLMILETCAIDIVLSLYNASGWSAVSTFVSITFIIYSESESPPSIMSKINCLSTRVLL